MNRVKKIKGIIAVATAVFMLLSFVTPDMGMFGELRVKAAVATYSVDSSDSMMNLDNVFQSDNTTNNYFKVEDDTVTIIKGDYKIETTNSGGDSVKGYKLSKNLVVNGGTITIKQYSGTTDHAVRILTNGKNVTINGGEINSTDDKVAGVIRGTGASLDDTEGTGESTIKITGGTVKGGKNTVLIDASFDGVFQMTGGSIVNNTSTTEENASSACIWSQDKTATINIEGGTITKTGTSLGKTNSFAIAVSGGTVVLGNGTDAVNISSSETGVFLNYSSSTADKYSGVRSLTVNDKVTISAPNFAIGNYGTGTTEDVARASTIVINGGTIKSVKSGDTEDGGCAVYHPGYGNLTINGGTLEGTYSGVEARNGKIDIKGGTIKSTYSGDAVSVVARNGGNTTAGAGIAIAPHSKYVDLNVSISDADVEGVSALYVSNPMKAKYVGASTGTASATGYGSEGAGFKFALSVTGGTFTAKGTGQKAADIIIDDTDKGMTVGTTLSAELTDALESSIIGGVFNTSEDEFAASATNGVSYTSGKGSSAKTLYTYDTTASGMPAASITALKQKVSGSGTTPVKTDKIQITKGAVILPTLSGLHWYKSDNTIASGKVEYNAGTSLTDEARIAANTYTVKAENPVQIVSTATLEVNKTINLKTNITGRPSESTENYKFTTMLTGCSISNSGSTLGTFTSGSTTGTCTVNIAIGATDEYGPKSKDVVVTVTPHTHKGMARTAGKDATCTEDGAQTYYTCSDPTCNKKFLDAEGTTEVTDIVIPALGHILTPVPAKEATCLEEGNTAYWSCSRCNKLFTDDKGEHSTTLAATKIAKLKHATSFHGAKDATCDEDGNKAYWQCDSCDGYFNDKEATKPTSQEAVVIPKLKHKMTAHDEIKATCTEDGQKAYWTCSVCRKTYTDAAGTTELKSTADLVIKSTGHKIQEEKEVVPTCTEAGKKAHFSCSECGKLFSDKDGNHEVSGASLVEKASGHDLTLHAAKDVDCTTDGNKTYWSCGICGKLFLDIDGINETTLEDVTVKCEGHKLTGHEAIKGSCTEDGMKAYWDCSVCKKYFSDANGKNEITLAEVFLPAEGHKLIHFSATDPGKTTYGNTEYWKCSVCGTCFADGYAKTEIDEAETKIPPTEHILVKHDAEEADCEREGHVAYWHCTDCGKYYSDAEAKNEITDLESIKTPALGHVWGSWMTTKIATKTKPGVKTRTCLRNSLHVQTVGIAPTGDEDFPELMAPKLSYRVYMQKKGWMKSVESGAVAGIKGQALRLEAFRIKLENADGGISYRAYVQKMGWQASKSNNMIAGTMGKSRRLEAVQIKLTGDVASDYNIYYRVYTQKYGWLGWTKDGGTAGTQGYGYRVEAMQIKLVERGAASPVTSGDAYLKSTDEQEMYVISSIEDETGIPRTLTYNKYGLLAKDSYKGLCDVTYTYNSKSQLSKAVVDIKGEGQETYKYTYDSSGKRTKVNFIGTTGTSRQRMYSYDSAGNLASFGDRSYSCDSSGRIEKMKAYSISAWEDVSYDSYGNIKAIGTSEYANKYMDSKLVQNIYGKYTYKKIKVRNDKVDLVKEQQWSLLNGDIDALFTVVIGWG